MENEEKQQAREKLKQGKRPKIIAMELGIDRKKIYSIARKDKETRERRQEKDRKSEAYEVLLQMHTTTIAENKEVHKSSVASVQGNTRIAQYPLPHVHTYYVMFSHCYPPSPFTSQQKEASHTLHSALTPNL